MADKRRVKKTIKQVQRVKTWQLIILLILALLVSATFLRLNNIGMIERRTAVEQSDKRGDRTALFNNLYSLQRYVSEHMNADPGRIALEHQYQRDVDAIKKKAEQSDRNGGSPANRKAAAVCDPQAAANGWRWPDPRYISCIDTVLKSFPAAERPSNLELPNANLYYHTFVSPRWSPDFAGWSLVVTGVIFLMIIIRTISLLILKALLRKHYSSV